MLMNFEYFVQVWSTILANSNIAFSKLDTFNKFNLVKDAITSLMNISSSSLFLVIVLLQASKCSSLIGMVIVKGAWSKVRCQSGRIWWVFSSVESLWRNIKLMTEFESFTLSKYLVGIWSVENERLRLKKSAITIILSLMEEWWL